MAQDAGSLGFGGILADDMGLGKTIQVIALLLSAAQEGTSLIVCPASLIYNWEHELYRFAPSLKTATAAGTMSERRELLARMEEYQVVITSYELLKRDQEWYEKQKFRFQIIDEAQCIKNAATKSAKAVKAVRARTRFAPDGNAGGKPSGRALEYFRLSDAGISLFLPEV